MNQIKRMNQLSETTRYFLKRFAAYALLFAIIGYCRVHFRSGPCTPNLDIVTYLMAGIICLVLLIKNGAQAIFWRQQAKAHSFLIHLAGAFTLYLMGA